MTSRCVLRFFDRKRVLVIAIRTFQMTSSKQFQMPMVRLMDRIMLETLEANLCLSTQEIMYINFLSRLQMTPHPDIYLTHIPT